MSSDRPSFIARWSRLKHAAEREAARPAKEVVPETHAPSDVGKETGAANVPVPSAASVHDTAPATETPLPPIESLDGLRSDYQAFFRQPVDEKLRHAALKKLFADPHFNQMDMLDVYVDDYTQFEPLPPELRLRLPSARSFLLDSERAAVEAAETATSDSGKSSVVDSGVLGADSSAPDASVAKRPTDESSSHAAAPDVATGSDSSSS